jgi:hypothetical protein
MLMISVMAAPQEHAWLRRTPGCPFHERLRRASKSKRGTRHYPVMAAPPPQAQEPDPSSGAPPVRYSVLRRNLHEIVTSMIMNFRWISLYRLVRQYSAFYPCSGAGSGAMGGPSC